MDVEVFERHVRRSLLPDSFSDHHATLLKICFRAAVTPYSSSVSMMMEPLPVAELLPADLKRMYDMVLLEFASALAKEMMGSDETRPTAPDPHIYDVFLMETTMDRPTKHIAVCVPVRKRRDLAWYNGGDDLIPLSALSPKWRVASLSGSARVLQYLAEPPCLLSKMAMQRSMLVGALEQEHAEPTLSRLMIERGSDDDDNWRQRIQTLNESQRQALATVISPSFQQGFFAIQGPPGCGKTSVLVAMIASIGTGILVVAPSNAAVANIARKVHETGRFRLDEMSVYGENADPTVHFFHPRIRGDKFAEVALQWEVAAENNAPKQEQLRRGMMAWLQLTDDDDDNDDDAANDEKEGDFCFTMAHMRELCPHFNMGSRGGRSSLAAHLGKSKVVFATLNAAGSPMLTNSLRGSVHTLMLDEGGQTAEADFFIATHFPGVKKIVVVGDPMQLPATVIDPDCKRAGFGVSWLSKVHQLFPEKVHLLDTQYRMDPGILLFPNRTFYQNRILSGDNVHSREPYVEYPFLFINTSRRGSEEKNAFSFQNVYESVAIQALLFRDTDIQRLVNESRSGVRIIVISPYRAQVKLLKGFLSCPRNCTLDIATVDSFQGQEGDIVILSTVRTQNIGFADDMQRLNVAITRAKRILRVVGDSNFFCSLPMGSTLRNLCEFARHMAYSQESQVRREAWSRPNWSEPTLWKPVANVRFHECLKGMPVRDRNVCYNTLHAVTTPDIIALGSRIPVRNHPAGNTSYLKGHGEYPRIVWIAKTGSDRPVIEAHFAGSRAECNRFVQMHGSYTPPEAEAVKADLSGIVMVHKEPRSVAEDALLLNQPFASWPVTNSSQSAICDGEELPLGAVQLDGHQEAVARSTPPLIIESRSGTGKTLVLLQHAAYHADTSDDRAACFVTVSPRLRRQLLQTYRKMNEAANLSLPPTNFYSLEELLNGLLEQSGAGECFKSMDKCRFLGFVQSRNSYEQSRVEPHMVENEVGGVICGSIDAALQCAPLSREQYLTTIRSNIDNKTERGCKERHLVYDDYERYAAWKNENGKFDVSDAVLRLLKEPWKVVFSAAYLDEIQDLSYAAIYLICNIAGKDTLRWVVCGDRNQMISMGSSFTFAGLKDTLLAVRQGIECKLSKVSHLAVNYRTTRDVLLLGNEILSVAKRAFPEAIRFAYPETSKKDLGISVVLCDWAATFSQTGIRLGRNQALIYSSSDPEAFEKAATDWIGSHPFILSSLDSKGLEFDDVIVAFDLDRKTWRVEEKRIATLRMLRELYVAVTRAQRRVVILIQKNIKSMQSFFDELQYDFQVTGAEFVRMEFDQETTAEMWRQKGHDLFDDAQYFMASRCFDSSGDRSWSQWAKGRHLQELGNKPEAIEAYHLAFVAFFDCEEFERALDVALMLTHFALWSTIDSKKLDFALRKCPEYLERTDVVRLTLLCGRWDEVTIEDFKEAYLSDIFMIYRENQVLKSMVKGALDADRTEMEDSMPAIVGDYYRDVGASDEAVRLYIQAQDMNSAQDMTNAALESFKTSGNGQAVLSRCVDHWKKSSKIPKERKTALLLDMFWSPTKTAKSSAQDCMRLFGRSVVIASVDYAIASVDYAKLDRCALYDFSTSDFIVEVTDALVLKFPRQLVEVVRWFASRNKFQATQFTKKRLSKWTNKEICSIAVILRRPEEWISNELHKRKELGSCILAVMGSTMLSPQGKLDFADTLLKHKLLLTGTEQSLVDLVCKLFHKELDVGDISSLVDKHIHGFPWSEDNLIRLAQKLKGVAQILKTAEPTSHVEYPALYAGFYRRVATNDLIKAIETTPQNDQSWLLRAFAHYEIPIERHVPVSFAIDFMGWAFQAELPEVALQMTWKALSIISPTSAQTHWFAAVVDQWQSEEKYRPWLLERHQDQQQQQVWEILVTANPRVACRESGDCILASLLYYGPALTRYWWAHRGESYSATALARWEEHVKQLCVALAERKVAGVSAAGSSNTNINNAGKTNGKSKKKKNVGKKNNRKK